MKKSIGLLLLLSKQDCPQKGLYQKKSKLQLVKPENRLDSLNSLQQGFPNSLLGPQNSRQEKLKRKHLQEDLTKKMSLNNSLLQSKLFLAQLPQKSLEIQHLVKFA